MIFRTTAVPWLVGRPFVGRVICKGVLFLPQYKNNLNGSERKNRQVIHHLSSFIFHHSSLKKQHPPLYYLQKITDKYNPLGASQQDSHRFLVFGTHLSQMGGFTAPNPLCWADFWHQVKSVALLKAKCVEDYPQNFTFHFCVSIFAWQIQNEWGITREKPTESSTIL